MVLSHCINVALQLKQQLELFTHQQMVFLVLNGQHQQHIERHTPLQFQQIARYILLPQNRLLRECPVNVYTATRHTKLVVIYQVWWTLTHQQGTQSLWWDIMADELLLINKYGWASNQTYWLWPLFLCLVSRIIKPGFSRWTGFVSCRSGSKLLCLHVLKVSRPCRNAKNICLNTWWVLL